MKRISILLPFVFMMIQARSQPFNVDSLRKKIDASSADTNQVLMLGTLSTYYNHNHLDSGIYYVHRMIRLSQNLDYPYGEAWGLSILPTSADRTGDMAKSLKIALSCLHYAEKLKYGKDEICARAYTQIGTVNFLTGHNRDAVSYLRKALAYAEKWNSDEAFYYQIFAHMGYAFRKEGMLDSAAFYTKKAYTLSFHSNDVLFYPYVRNCLADVYEDLGNLPLAKQFYSDAIIQGIKINHLFQLSYSYSQMSDIFNKTGMPDSSIYFSKKSLDLSQKFLYGSFIPQAAEHLSTAFEKLHEPDSALKYLKIMMNVKEKVMNETKQQQFQLLDFEEQQRQEKALMAEQQYRVQVRTALLIGGLLVLGVLMSLLYHNNRVKQKSNRQLLGKTRELETAMYHLNETQSQLIQSEKMASLGELTAGIAHEIQNPLNFVNNFSEVNTELIDEAEAEIDKGNMEETRSILKDIRENEQKINHHGKRADAIVKGMLQHSHSNTGKKEATDINALADEYLRLSYHGLRAKDKEFNAILNTDFDCGIGKISIIPQDMGRVLLNLYYNAFYAVAEKKKQHPEGYEPAVSVSTKKKNDKVEISVSDNGNGIPQKVMNKIFQPFFTTKPTGKGTGLGLSLSYDIIKAHGGEITVDTKESEGTTFKMQLPVV